MAEWRPPAGGVDWNGGAAAALPGWLDWHENEPVS
jgi:hypothetical protein